jgi:hypothetical protein
MRHGIKLALLAAFLVVAPSRADEGMWLFNNPPTKLLKERYNFEPTKEWLEHVQKSCVRFPHGSGSFVSPDGLVMTNHHVASTAIKSVSTEENDYVANGFQARTRAEEKKCPGLELLCLQSIEDVTKQVNDAVKPDLKPDQAFEARRAIIATIEKDSEKKTGLRSDVVTLYQGGQYHLYRYKRYTDVRLVFAPEQQIAFYGGDPDNFAFPRYDLDVTFFRVYEDDKPAKIEHFLRWSKNGPQKDELVFVIGHPGRTDRLNTFAELEYLRDKGYPFLLERLYRWEVMANVFSGNSIEHERRAKDFLFSMANSRKAIDGELAGLLDPALMAKKKADEKKFRDALAEKDEFKDARKAFDKIAEVQNLRKQNIRKYTLLEGGAAFNSTLFGYARTLLRAAEEYAKPNEKRLEEYSDSAKKSLEIRLLSKRDIYDDFETTKLADSLTWLAEQLGSNNDLVKKVLAGKSPRERAAELVLGSKLKEVDVRKKLYEGGKDAVKAAKDPMIELARLVDKEARAVRKVMQTKMEEVKKQAYDQIAKARFALEGANTYPDATFTLRLAFGTCKGYEEDGKQIPFETHFAGLYKKAEAQKYRPPFDLPKRWLDRKDKLNLKTPFNFVCTADIIGGNSGSPVINKEGEVVGLIFDGNIQSLVWDFVFTDKQGRSVAVCSQAIPEALRAIYEADEVANELANGNKGADK